MAKLVVRFSTIFQRHTFSDIIVCKNSEKGLIRELYQPEEFSHINQQKDLQFLKLHRFVPQFVKDQHYIQY